ncbi:MAG: hypothetical protein ABWY05_11540 [Noviherbaspirillum sp.]
MAMETSWNSPIRRAILRRPEAVVDVTILLWEKLAVELASIIGEGGFQSVYLRSGAVAATRFPWLVLNASLQETDLQFAGLRSSLEGRDVEEAAEASVVLLDIFLDILTSLIGELLMTNLLHSAWGDDVFNSN